MNSSDVINESLSFNAEKTFFFGLDLETGGLNDATNSDDSSIPDGLIGSQHYAILQAAVIVYDGYFNQVSKKPINIIIKHDKDHLLNHVGDWSKNQFKDTLMVQCPKSTQTLKDAENEILKHFDEIGIDESKNVFMLGNSIRLDYAFVSSQMPKLKERLHYRILDVSTLKVLFSALYGNIITKFNKEGSHDALKDIEESLAELKFYIQHFIKPFDQVSVDYIKSCSK